MDHPVDIQNIRLSYSSKVGAKFTGTNFAPDEYLNEHNAGLTLTHEGKRDRWNGYDPSAHQDVVDDYVKMEELRQRMRKEKMTKKDVDPTGWQFIRIKFIAQKIA